MPPSEPIEPEIDIEELMAKIRGNATRKQMIEPSPMPHSLQNAPSSTASSGPTLSFNWPQLNLAMGQMGLYVDVGAQNLPMEKFPRFLRWMARFTGRIVLFLSEVVTNPQRKFNHSTLEALQLTAEVTRRLEQRLQEQDQRIAGLEQSLRERDQ